MKQIYFDQNKIRMGEWISLQELPARGSPASLPSSRAPRGLSRNSKSRYNSTFLAGICCQFFFFSSLITAHLLLGQAQELE